MLALCPKAVPSASHPGKTRGSHDLNFASHVFRKESGTLVTMRAPFVASALLL